MKYLTFILFFSGGLYADVLGGEVSFGLFHHNAEGTTQYHSSHTIHIANTLQYTQNQNLFLQAYIEHPIPLLPNVKLAYAPLLHSHTADVSNFSWGDIHNYNGPIESSFTMHYTDATLYYELLDNWVELDTGFTFRFLKGSMNVTTIKGKERVSYAGGFPLLYAKARFLIPSTELSFQLETNLVALSSITSYDYALSARYTLTLGLGLEAGYKQFSIKSDILADGFQIDTSFSGLYAAVVWDF